MVDKFIDWFLSFMAGMGFDFPTNHLPEKVEEKVINELSDMEDGFYYIYSDIDNSRSLVKLYTNPDIGENGVRGFGFGIWDGGGFLPLSDVGEETKVLPVYQLDFDIAKAYYINGTLEDFEVSTITSADQTI